MSIDFPKTEEDTVRFWREIDAFQTQLRLTEGLPRFNFYDGPPFGMLISGLAVLRYDMLYGVTSLLTTAATCTCSNWYRPDPTPKPINGGDMTYACRRRITL